MRITNKIMQDNALSNINTNKVLQDKLMTQMASGKKIQRPSDDPVIAIRALRLRSTLSDITQYNDRNAEDAESWLKVTEDSILSLEEAIEDMIEQCNQGANEDLQTENREAILKALKELQSEIYATGDADYANRGVFTGYRTSTKLRFQAKEQLKYNITERVDKSVMDDITYVKMNNANNTIGQINAGNYNDPAYAIEDTDVYEKTVHRLRLSYENIDADTVPQISYYNGPTDAAGTANLVNVPVTVISKYDLTQDPYLMQGAGGTPISGAVFIPETGELILDDNTYQRLSAIRDYSGTKDVDESKISITYAKTEWEKGDLRPEHYFECTEDPGGKNIEHNLEKYEKADDQIISYDVGFNQEIRVNTLAEECYTHAIGRDVDDMIAILEQVGDVEATVNTLTEIIKDPKTTEDDRVKAEKNLTAANKALVYLKDKLQVTFENGITKMQGHLDKAALALTDVGTRGSKLKLVQNRLASQKTNFKDLVSDNEQADTAEVGTDLKSAQLAYDASLMATGKITQSTLMNFI